MNRNSVQTLLQQKAEIAAGLTASGAAVTWVEQANQYVDLAAGMVAIIAGTLTIIWYIKKFRQEREWKKNGNTGEQIPTPTDTEK